MKSQLLRQPGQFRIGGGLVMGRICLDWDESTIVAGRDSPHSSDREEQTGRSNPHPRECSLPD